MNNQVGSSVVQLETSAMSPLAAWNTWLDIAPSTDKPLVPVAPYHSDSLAHGDTNCMFMLRWKPKQGARVDLFEGLQGKGTGSQTSYALPNCSERGAQKQEPACNMDIGGTRQFTPMP